MRKDTLKLKQEREGKQFTNKNGTKFIIIEYNNANSVLIEFCDEYKYKFYTTYNVCKEGNVKNPYDKTICNNMGCLGLMSDGSKPKTTNDGKNTREYSLWRHMLQRCYSGEHPTYANVTVCDRWLVYANFIEDLPLIEGYELWLEHHDEGIALDKDIKQVGIKNKVYSLDTCKFITKSENTREMNERCDTSTRISNFNSNNFSKKVIAKSLTEPKVLVFKSMRQAEKFGFNRSNISACCNGERKTHKGYTWSCI